MQQKTQQDIIDELNRAGLQAYAFDDWRNWAESVINVMNGGV